MAARRGPSPLSPVLFAAAVLVAFLPSASTAGPALQEMFVERPLELADTHDLFDLGVVDFDGDGFHDIFTTNHNARQSLLEGDGDLSFTRDVVTGLGLDQTRAFPGYERYGSAPREDPGLRFWRQGPLTVAVEAVSPESLQPNPFVEAVLTTYGEVRVTEISDQAHVTVREARDGSDRRISVVRLRQPRSGVVLVQSELGGVPISVDVRSPEDPSRIGVGPAGLAPRSRAFTVELRDRHGMAWADINDDGRKDVFIARGGLRDQLDEFPGLVADELLLREGAGTVDVAAMTGIEKGTCRSRSVTWVDVDGDGDLDLFVTCIAGSSQLWRRDGVLEGSEVPATPRFVDISSSLPEGLVPSATLWHDVRGDRRPELIAAGGGGIGLYAQDRHGDYVQRQFFEFPGSFNSLTLADVNRNGYADIYAASNRGSVLLRGRQGGFRALSPPPLGLPPTARSAIWVDIDNSGRVDLLAAPGGIYRQGPNGRFTETGALSDRLPAGVNRPVLVAFDADNDGDRDLLIAYPTAANKEWVVSLLENLAVGNRWVQLELVGPPGNREAVGAVVRIVADGATSTHWVGESEGSRFSQGAYRVYIGLGTAEVVEAIEITWPDGTVQAISPALDEVLTVQYPA